jgi:sugar transferase EpsL
VLPLIKRCFDILLASLLLIVLSPILLITALFVRIKLGSPVLFVQDRPGYKGKIFRLIKFRTMLDTRDKGGNMLPDVERLTHFGKILRALSLDELPELWNVIKGEMSLVGPRPLLIEYLPLYSEHQKQRHDVRPGITGLAQVKGRNALSWEDKFEFDIWYVDNQSLWLDIKIVCLTIKKVVKRDGITSQGSVSADKFKGDS